MNWFNRLKNINKRDVHHNINVLQKGLKQSGENIGKLKNFAQKYSQYIPSEYRDNVLKTINTANDYTNKIEKGVGIIEKEFF